MGNNNNNKKQESKLIIKPKANINLSKTKAKIDMKLGDKLNAEIQGYGKTKNLVKGSDKLKGAGVKI